MGTPRGAPVPVRGSCPAGHVVETYAAPGRQTWRGTCPTAGCDHVVIARRVPIPERPAPKGNKRKSAAGRTTDGTATVRRATYRDRASTEKPPRFEELEEPERRELERSGADEHSAERVGIGPHGATADGGDGGPEVHGAPGGAAAGDGGRGRWWRRLWGTRTGTGAGGDGESSLFPGLF